MFYCHINVFCKWCICSKFHKVVGNNTVDIQSNGNVLNSNSISEKSDLQSSTTKTTKINITNNFRYAHSPGYPNHGNTINQANYDNWAWTVINMTIMVLIILMSPYKIMDLMDLFITIPQ